MNQRVDIHVEKMKSSSSVIGIKNIYKYKAPPENHPNGMYCPNCEAWTWQTARQCVECPFDIWLHFEDIKQQHRKKVLKKRSMKLMISAAVCFGIGYLFINFFSVTFGVILVFIALFIFKLGADIEQAI